MNLEEFIAKTEEAMDDIEPGTITPTKHFQDIEHWSSMHALLLIAMVDTEYDVLLSGEDLRKCENISDVYQIVNSRKNG